MLESRAGNFKVTAWTYPWEEESWSSMQEWKDVLDEVSPFWYLTLPNGTIIKVTDEAEDPALIDFCRDNTISLMPLVSNLHDPETVRLIVRDEVVQQKHIQDLLELTLLNHYRGIEINYESLYTEDKFHYVDFIGNLTRAFHSKGKLVHVSVFPKTDRDEERYGPAGYDYEGLGREADFVRIMAYNLHWSSCEVSGPITSYEWVSEVIDYALERISPGKIILGIPLFGYDWPIYPNGRTKGIADNYTFEDVEALRQKFDLERKWNITSRTPYFLYKDSTGTDHALHFCDSESLLHEMDIVGRNSLRGISIWRLGGEDPSIKHYIDMLKSGGLSNLPPYASVGDDIIGMRGIPIRIGPVRAYDIDGVIETHIWDFGDGNSSNLMDPEYVYQRGGFYTATYTAIDDDGRATSFSKEVRIGPYAHIGGVINGIEGVPITFDGSGSWDPYQIVSYSWDFGDGSGLFHSLPVVNHTYERPGTYDVSLTVINNMGFTDTGYCIVIVPDTESPVAVAGEDMTVWEDAEITFDARGSTDNGIYLTYEWNISGFGVLIGDMVTHVFTDPGTYSVVLNVTDEAGLSDLDAITVKVKDRTPPEIRVTHPREVAVREPIVLNCSGSSDNVGIDNITWNLGYGHMRYGVTEVTSLPTSAGRHHFTLSLLDGEANWNSTSFHVDVLDRDPPWFEYSIDPTPKPLESTFLRNMSPEELLVIPEDFAGVVLTNNTLLFTMYNSTDDTGISSVTWFFGDGGWAGGYFAFHTYTDPGLYRISVTVYDIWGNQATREASLLAIPSWNVTVDHIYMPANETVPENVTEEEPDVNITETENTTSPGGLPAWIWISAVVVVAAIIVADIVSLARGDASKFRRRRRRPGGDDDA